LVTSCVLSAMPVPGSPEARRLVELRRHWRLQEQRERAERAAAAQRAAVRRKAAREESERLLSAVAGRGGGVALEAAEDWAKDRCLHLAASIEEALTEARGAADGGGAVAGDVLAVKDTIAEAGGVAAVIGALREHRSSAGVQHAGCLALSLLVRNHPPNTTAALQAEGPGALLAALREHPADERVLQSACDALFYLSVTSDSKAAVVGTH
jgi:hypothetical protein